MSAAETTAPPGLAAQIAMLREGRVTATELVERSLARVAATQSTLNAFRCVREQAALAEAASADERLAAGERAPLLGAPVAIKDDMDLAGETTMFGCEGDFPVVERDGEVARRLKAAGAIIIGKTNTPELGQWPITEGPAFGKTRNPWSAEHTPGGSSGGSAAAVAAGLVAAAIGSDGAGSVRIPASWTNLVGLKPQRGRISTWPAAEAFKGLTSIGPLTRTVADAALTLDAINGNRLGDRDAPPPPDRSYAKAAQAGPGRRLRIALSLRVPLSGVPARLDPRVGARVGEVATALAALGHDVIEDDLPLGPIGLAFMPRATAGIAEWVKALPDRERRDERTLGAARTGRLLGGPTLGAARAAERVFRARLGPTFERYDIVLSPTTAQPPLRCGAIDGLTEWETDKVIVGACPFAWPWNVLGWPALSVPAGFVGALPVGAQLLGPANCEGLLLAVAAQLEADRRWDLQVPPPFCNCDAEAG